MKNNAYCFNKLIPAITQAAPFPQPQPKLLK